MNIHFCDLCNESVPQSDLDQGLAFLRKGRVVCASCDRSMSGEGPGSGDGPGGPFGGQPGFPAQAADGGRTATLAPPALATAALPAAAQARADARLEPRPTGAGGWLALVTLVFGAVAIALLVDRIGELERETQDVRAAIAGQLGHSQQMFSSAVVELQERERGIQDTFEQRFAFERSRVDAELAKLAANAGEASTAAAGALASLGTVKADVERAAGGDRKAADDLAQRLKLVEEDLRFYSQRLTDLELASLHPAAALPAAPEPTGPAWQAALPDLANELASVRLDAVYALSESGDPAVVEHLLPLLGDVDVFVRMATARVLGDLQARAAVPALIDALDDPDTAVREVAFAALKLITGRDFRYDPYASEGERAKRIKAWRDWWEDEGSKEP